MNEVEKNSSHKVVGIVIHAFFATCIIFISIFHFNGTSNVQYKDKKTLIKDVEKQKTKAHFFYLMKVSSNLYFCNKNLFNFEIKI